MQDDLPVTLTEYDTHGNIYQVLARTALPTYGTAVFEEAVRLMPHRRYVLSNKAHVLRKHNVDKV